MFVCMCVWCGVCVCVCVCVGKCVYVCDDIPGLSNSSPPCMIGISLAASRNRIASWK